MDKAKERVFKGAEFSMLWPDFCTMLAQCDVDYWFEFSEICAPDLFEGSCKFPD